MGLKDQAWLRFYLTVREFIEALIYQGMCQRDPARSRFCLTLQDMLGLNLPKACVQGTRQGHGSVQPLENLLRR